MGTALPARNLSSSDNHVSAWASSLDDLPGLRYVNSLGLAFLIFVNIWCPGPSGAGFVPWSTGLEGQVLLADEWSGHQSRTLSWHTQWSLSPHPVLAVPPCPRWCATSSCWPLLDSLHISPNKSSCLRYHLWVFFVSSTFPSQTEYLLHRALCFLTSTSNLSFFLPRPRLLITPLRKWTHSLTLFHTL